MSSRLHDLVVEHLGTRIVAGELPTGAVLRTGNLPHNADSAVHAVDDVVLQASGPGAEAFKGYMEESDIYRVLADAFALAPAAR